MNEVFQKIIERINRYAYDIDEGDPNNDKIISESNAMKIVHEVAEEYKGGWIPCSERLPDVETDVLLSLRSLDIYTGFRANTEGCFYVEGEGYVECENVIAWQPLPSPFQEIEVNNHDD